MLPLTPPVIPDSTLQNWTEKTPTLIADHQLFFTDSLSFGDSVVAIKPIKLTGDSLNFADSVRVFRESYADEQLRLGFGYRLTDNLANYVDQAKPSCGTHPPADNLASYVESLSLKLGIPLTLVDPKPVAGDSVSVTGYLPVTTRLFTDAMPAYGDSVTLGVFGVRIVISDSLQQWIDQAIRDQGTPGMGGYGRWWTQELIGMKDGQNQTFTVTRTPVIESMSVYMNGVRLVRVSGSPTPGEAQYGVSGTTVVLGQPPRSNQWVQARYFYESLPE